MKLIVLFVIFCAKTAHLYGDTMEMDDSIVIHAARRSPRQILGLPQRETTVWGNVLREGSACLTSRGHLGFCTSVKHCYPYFKLPNLGLWESWVLGNYDTCTYFDSKGSPAFGVCCTNPITLPPSTTPSEEEAEKPETSEKPNEEEMVTETQKPEVQKPDANKSPSVWPPPIPTHPPDHTPATHPPWVTGIGHPIAGIPIAVPVAPGTTKPTTKRPGIATTWPTRPPVFQWPPTTTPAPILPTRPSTTTTSPQIPPQVPPSGINANCGVKNGYQDSERIVGGHNADPNEWPWIAVLFNGGRQFCGGSLIDNQHILTAAHCVAHMSSWDVARLTVQLGDHNIRSTTEVSHETRHVKRVVRHRGFDSRTLYDDVALLTLDTPVQFSSSIRPICLPPANEVRQYNGKTGVVIGWGSLRENGPQPSILQEVSIPIWSNDNCARKYGSAAPAGITQNMLCAGQDYKDSCSGDSGGPLMVNDGKWTQVGIVSWGIGCGKGQYPGVYTRVSNFMPWIMKNLS
ncbi:proclotting enzyme [Phlebotomus papatasi]|uniref:proclotting enzyme n=1 Tax=Phlebotomus papatasi TaxID=29031 RepID=UPI002483D07E|nr:proclotting enzyme [Phlebotomus papatasi]